jgi:hypothetical protein
MPTTIYEALIPQIVFANNRRLFERRSAVVSGWNSRRINTKNYFETHANPRR